MMFMITEVFTKKKKNTLQGFHQHIVDTYHLKYLFYYYENI